MKNIIMYTDGACSGNPGPGGWGVLLLLENSSYKKALRGSVNSTTNNAMELTAVIEGLKALKYPCNVTVYSDSNYIVNGISCGWAKNWRQNAWRTSSNKIVKNIPLWKELLNLCEIHTVKCIHVKGHENSIYNNFVDALSKGQNLDINMLD